MVVPPVGSIALGSTTVRSVFVSMTEVMLTRKGCCLGGCAEKEGERQGHRAARHRGYLRLVRIREKRGRMLPSRHITPADSAAPALYLARPARRVHSASLPSSPGPGRVRP